MQPQSSVMMILARTTLVVPDVEDDLTRRELLAGLVAAGVLAGCGGGRRGGGGDGDASRPATRTVTHRFGTFEVPAEPQRVVGLEGRRDLETALALDLPIVAVGSNALLGGKGLAPFIDLSLERVQVIQQTEPNLELIGSLRPDLILTRDSDIEELRDALVRIAPVIPVAGSGPWRPDLEQVATWLGRTAELASTLARYEGELKAVRDRGAASIASATVAVVQYSSEDKSFNTSPSDGFYLQANTPRRSGRTLPAFPRGAVDERVRVGDVQHRAARWAGGRRRHSGDRQRPGDPQRAGVRAPVAQALRGAGGTSRVHRRPHQLRLGVRGHRLPPAAR